jgi:hypothetical protein
VVAVAVVTVVTVVTMMSVMTMMVPMALLHNDHLRLRLNYHFLRWVSGLIALLRRLNVHLLGRVSGLSDDVASLSSHAVASTRADDDSRLGVAVLKKSQNREEINRQTHAVMVAMMVAVVTMMTMVVVMVEHTPLDTELK